MLWLAASIILSCPIVLLFFGCQGKKLRREILHLVRDLPSTYEDIAQRIQTLNSAVQYYVEFVAFLLSR